MSTTSAASQSDFFAALGTEQVNALSENLDQMTSLEIVKLMNAVTEDAIRAVDSASTQLAAAIDAVVDRMKRGGRLFYLGAGTSGRLGVLDASECPPTFGASPELVQGLIAGGDTALRNAVEGAEDNPELAAADLREKSLTQTDAIVAISASGYAPYCVGALRYARQVGALAIAMSCNKNANISKEADIAIEAPTGSEVLSGSTRLKAGTATKIMLNALSTGIMVRLGKCYKNLMVDVQPTNVKLRDRSIRIIQNATGLSREAAEALSLEAGGSIKTAIVMHEANVTSERARRALTSADGYVRKAIESLR
ncbi:MAG: N-acetylmuramic acid 6-phosphate etherase [Clostridia bacterium]|nr:N-acetylmuramic acid 6-phosphate etherase [Clostridia bacterium]